MKNAIHVVILVTIVFTTLAAAETTTVIFQQGLNGYNGCEDNELRSQKQHYDEGPAENVIKISEY